MSIVGDARLVAIELFEPAPFSTRDEELVGVVPAGVESGNGYVEIVVGIKWFWYQPEVGRLE